MITLSDTESDFFSIFGETEDQINDWCHATKFKIGIYLSELARKFQKGR